MWRMLLLLILVAVIFICGCAAFEAFVRGAGEAAGITVPDAPLTATDYLSVIGGIAASVAVGGWSGLKLSQKFGKTAKVANILSHGLLAAKECDSTKKLADITDAVGKAAENANVKSLMDAIYETVKKQGNVLPVVKDAA